MLPTRNASNPHHDYEGDVVVETRPKVKQPKKYRVIMLNDDYTSMEFVVFVLKTIFHKSDTQAESLMMTIHLQGRGIVGIYTREIAETKVAQTLELAKLNEFPLQCIVEEE